ncbi:MAG: hypothetical protein B6I20_08240 [Bacteroidetes bacterium 4572_117]|nr:MAG: hypothetical protein B6I20_08240 [Bacteroidetes bacterium 4572_117]
MEFDRLLHFLNQLNNNNNRDWFNSNKKEFVELKEQFEAFINQLIPKVKHIDGFKNSLSAKDCIFRIYRDVRFSKNKEPYKSHFGAYIADGGRKSPYAGYYVHIEPGKSFAGGGIYKPEPTVLKELRYEIMDKVDEFKKIIFDKGFKKIYTELYGEQLKNPPRGFPKNFADIELLKLKSYALVHPIDDKIIKSETFENYLLNLFETAKPFNMFFNKVISEI